MPPETIQIMCPNLTCRKILAVPVAARGKTVRCRGCGMTIRIPTAPGGPKAPTATDSESKPKAKS